MCYERGDRTESRTKKEMAVNGNKIQVIICLNERKKEGSVHNVKGQENGSRDILGETKRSEIQEALLVSIKPYM